MVIRPKTQLTIKIEGHGTSHSRSEIKTADHVMVIDEPVARGGTGEGSSPTETAYASLVGCTHVIGNKCAKRLGVDVGNMAFEMEVDFDRRGVLLMEEVEVPFKAIRLAVTTDGPATQEDIERVAEETAKYCPISKLYVNSGTKLEVTWTKT